MAIELDYRFVEGCSSVFSEETSAVNLEISENAALKRSRSPSRLSALVFIYTEYKA